MPQPAVAMAGAGLWWVDVGLLLAGLAVWLWAGRASRWEYGLAALTVGIALRPDAMAYEAGLILGAVVFLGVRRRPWGAAGARVILALMSVFVIWAAVALGLWAGREAYPMLAAGSGVAGLPRFTSPLGHANYTSGLGLLLAPFFAGAAWAWRGTGRGRIAGVACALALGCLVGGGSRAALAAMALVLVVGGGVLALRRTRWRRGLGFGLPAALVLLMAHPSVWAWLREPRQRVGSDLIRWDYLRAAWGLFAESPWIGSADVPLALMAHAPAEAEHYSCYQVHSTPFQWGCEFGVGGWCLYFGLIVVVGRALWRAGRAASPCPVRSGVACSLAAYLLFAWFDYQLNVPGIAFPFFAMLGWLTSAHERPDSVRERPPVRVRMLAVALATGCPAVGLLPEAVQRYHLRQAASAKAAGTGPLLMALAQAPAVSSNPAVDALIGAYAMNALPKTEEDRARLAAIADAAWARACASPLAMPQFPVYRAVLCAPWDRPRALGRVREALHRFPKQPAAWVLLADLLEQEHRPAAALRAQAAAALVSPDCFYAYALRHAAAPARVAALLAEIRSLSRRYVAAYPGDAYAGRMLESVPEEMANWVACGGNVRRFRAMKQAKRPAEADPLDPRLPAEVLAPRLGAAIRARTGGEVSPAAWARLAADWSEPGPVSAAARARRAVAFKVELPTFGLFAHQGDHPVLPGCVSSEVDLFAALSVSTGDGLRLKADFLRHLADACVASPAGAGR